MTKQKSKDLSTEPLKRRNITLLEGNGKCRHLKKLTCKRTLRQVFISLKPRPHIPHPLTHCIRVFSILIHTGNGGGRERWTRERVRGATVHKAGSKIPSWLPQSPFTGKFFRWRYFFGVYIGNLSMLWRMDPDWRWLMGGIRHSDRNKTKCSSPPLPPLSTLLFLKMFSLG